MSSSGPDAQRLASNWSPEELDRAERTVSSSLWAAWADALGFISELTDETGLKRRIKSERLTDPVTWTRRVGGRYGVPIELPAGCYSDDTQLRLAVGRAISGHGFDVEAFARIELTTWPAYALGGGRASKAAAAAMSKANASWFSNTYDGWQRAGGNGVAMRIQPHVWAARDLAGTEYIADVLIDGVVSHGHPRALVGAVLNAAALAFSLRESRVPNPTDWGKLLWVTREAINIFESHEQLAHFWVPQWERTVGIPFAKVWEETVDECEIALTDVRAAVHDLVTAGSDPESRAVRDAYWKIIHQLGLATDAARGSGTVTVLAALMLAAALPDHPAHAARVAAQAIGTDTDTIATMAAAIVGAAAKTSVPDTLLDSNYLKVEARRLAAIAVDKQAAMFAYPDLLRWSPPRSQLDVVGFADGEPAIAGLGWLKPIGNSVASRDATWQWMETSFGPSALTKQRPVLRELPRGNWPERRRQVTQPPVKAIKSVTQRSDSDRNARAFDLGAQVLFGSTDLASRKDSPASSSATGPLNLESAPNEPAESSTPEVDVDRLMAWLKRRNFDDQSVGYAVTRVSELGTIEQLIGLTASLRPILRRRGSA